MADIITTLEATRSILKLLIKPLKICWNIISRPNISIKATNLRIKFSHIDKEKKQNYYYPYVVLILKNKTDKPYSLNLSNILISGDKYFSNGPNKMNSDEFLSENNIINYYKEKHHQISQHQQLPIDLGPYVEQILPLNSKPNRILLYKKHALLFKANNKVVVSLEINGKLYDYGVDRQLLYEKYLNYLAFEQDHIFNE